LVFQQGYKDTRLGQGRENSKIFLNENNKILKLIEKDVRTYMYGTTKDKEKVLSEIVVAETKQK